MNRTLCYLASYLMPVSHKTLTTTAVKVIIPVKTASRAKHWRFIAYLPRYTAFSYIEANKCALKETVVDQVCELLNHTEY